MNKPKEEIYLIGNEKAIPPPTHVEILTLARLTGRGKLRQSGPSRARPLAKRCSPIVATPPDVRQFFQQTRPAVLRTCSSSGLPLLCDDSRCFVLFRWPLDVDSREIELQPAQQLVSSVHCTPVLWDRSKVTERGGNALSRLASFASSHAAKRWACMKRHKLVRRQHDRNVSDVVRQTSMFSKIGREKHFAKVNCALSARFTARNCRRINVPL